jgi:hypothetical protein
VKKGAGAACFVDQLVSEIGGALDGLGHFPR